MQLPHFLPTMFAHQYVKGIVVVVLTILLSGCGRMTVRQICAQHPQLCQDIETDGSCRYRRTHVIEARYQRLLHPDNDQLIYPLLLKLERFRDCISKTAQVEAVKNKGRITLRMNSYLAAERAINKLEQEAKQSHDPHLLYYRWSRFDDHAARDEFLELAQKGQLETAELQKFLASYYGANQPRRARQALMKSLSLHSPDEPIDNDVLETLATMYFQSGDYKHSYIWTVMANENSDGDVAVQLDFIARKGNITRQQRTQLEKIALVHLNEIKKGRFEPNTF